MRREVKNADQFRHNTKIYTHSEGRKEERERRESQWKPIDGMARQEGGELGGKSPRSGPETRRCDSWACGGRIFGRGEFWASGSRVSGLKLGSGGNPGRIGHGSFTCRIMLADLWG